MIKTLTNLFKQDKEKFVVPKGVQDVLPVVAIFDDGIFKVGKDKYSKTFKFTDINLAREAKNRLIHDYIDQPKYSKACASLDDGFEDAFQYTVQGNSHNRLKSTNLIERLNQEVRRREKIIRIFPNQTSANRLIGAVLMDLHDEWIYSSRKYINFDKQKW